MPRVAGNLAEPQRSRFFNSDQMARWRAQVTTFLSNATRGYTSI